MKYKATTKELQEIVAATSSMRQCLTLLGLANQGGNYQSTWKRIKEAGVDYSHWKGQGWRKGSSTPTVAPKTNEEMFKKGALFNSNFRARVIRDNLVPYICAISGCPTKNVAEADWLNKPLGLHLDHIDGDRYNNEISNLRFLCPNCHSQTETYCRSKS